MQLTLPLAGERTTRRVQGRVAVKGWCLGTLGAEWQCGRDCQTGVSVPNRYARGRVAVKGWDLGTLGAEWQCISHCHSLVNVPHVTFKAEWQCNRYARGRVAVRLTLPLDGERTTPHVQGRVAVQSVRSMPSGSADSQVQPFKHPRNRSSSWDLDIVTPQSLRDLPQDLWVLDPLVTSEQQNLREHLGGLGILIRKGQE